MDILVDSGQCRCADLIEELPQRTNQPLNDCGILIVDDDPEIVQLLETLLGRMGYRNIRTTTQPLEVVSLVTGSLPDIVLLDANMPGKDGFEVLKDLDPFRAGTFLPVVMLTSQTTGPFRERALSEGCSDFLAKPFDVVELGLRIRNLLMTRVLHVGAERQNERLEFEVTRRTEDLHHAITQLAARSRDLESAHSDSLHRLAIAAEFRDEETAGHLSRMASYAALLAERLGLDADRVAQIRQAMPMHDIGKLGVRDAVLFSDGILGLDEIGEMRAHASNGFKILSGAGSDLIELAA